MLTMNFHWGGMMDKRIQLIVKGKVQGVFFRDYTSRKARELGLKGTVRNRSDGAVEIHAQGQESQLKELEKWCWNGSPLSHVIGVDRREMPDLHHYPDFRVVF